VVGSFGRDYCYYYRHISHIRASRNYHSANTNLSHFLASTRNCFCYRGADFYEKKWMWNLISDILSIIAGVVILMYSIISPSIVFNLLILLIGVLVLFNGAVRFTLALKGRGLGMGILGVLTLILGLLLLTNSLVGVLVLPWVFGFFLIFGGLGAVIGGIKMRT